MNIKHARTILLICLLFTCTVSGLAQTQTIRAMIEKAHKADITVSLWPGTSVEDFMLGVYLGCDRMCTDIPVKVKEWMGKNAPWVKVTY